MTSRIEAALTDCDFATPFLVLDCEHIAQNYRDFATQMDGIGIFYAVKANPHPKILSRLAAEGAMFDCASFQEIGLVLAAGATADRISFGSTIKKPADIAKAFAAGVRHFVFDAEEELDKIAAHAPGADVTCRILTNSDGAGSLWPLSRKFGCDDAMAITLLSRANQRGLRPRGLSFHVGSQQLETAAWELAIAQCGAIFRQLQTEGITLDLINLGGGFPTDFRMGNVPHLTHYARAIDHAMNRHFGVNRPQLIAEPGRALVGDAGVIVSDVVLVSRKSAQDQLRWVYLDVGRFHGLAETEGESIRYRLSVPARQDEASEPAVIAGPTCDSVDTLYEKTPVDMPIGLGCGDRVLVHDTGAYTATYSSVGFNGFPPLDVYLLEDVISANLQIVKAG